MYFSPEPKKRKEDFFNMEEELEMFQKNLGLGKFIVVSGLRRYGKTSLILTALNSLGLDYIFVDCRLLPPGMFSLNDFIFLLEDELNRRSWAKRLLKNVDGVELSGLRLRFRRRDRTLLLNVIEKLEHKILVIDEAQELRRTNYRFDSLLAYIYDHIDLKVVISGSQVGLLYKFLRVKEPEAPLYGRPYLEVKLKRLNVQKSREFLERGFEQKGLNVSSTLIDEAVNRFDGIIGWLTYFGYSYARSRRSVEEVVEKASKMSVNELKHAIEVYGLGKKRYIETLKIVASSDSLRWSEIKRALEARMGKIPNNTLSNILENLVNQGFLEKANEGYSIADPILKIGILKHL
ncbi:MAG: ATP-binding protein [Nitrososphaeria archaeon]